MKDADSALCHQTFPKFHGLPMIEVYFCVAAMCLIGSIVSTCSGLYFPSRMILFERTGGALLASGAAMLGIGVRLLF